MSSKTRDKVFTAWGLKPIDESCMKKYLASPEGRTPAWVLGGPAMNLRIVVNVGAVSSLVCISVQERIDRSCNRANGHLVGFLPARK